MVVADMKAMNNTQVVAFANVGEHHIIPLARNNISTKDIPQIEVQNGKTSSSYLRRYMEAFKERDMIDLSPNPSSMAPGIASGMQVSKRHYLLSSCG
jgi:hypothetical protein